ncbi:hypothetical protein F5Y06DRAFT_297986 [Hypoxylon sp. FL0890]|nr:hypothetical protein F5Y06DRAFT_297986 [Hypoxylon sp. FL0890]
MQLRVYVLQCLALLVLLAVAAEDTERYKIVSQAAGNQQLQEKQKYALYEYWYHAPNVQQCASGGFVHARLIVGVVPPQLRSPGRDFRGFTYDLWKDGGILNGAYGGPTEAKTAEWKIGKYKNDDGRWEKVNADIAYEYAGPVAADVKLPDNIEDLAHHIAYFRMGQTTSSTSQPEPDLESQPEEPVSRIDTAEKFQTYLSYELRQGCLGYERYDLREAFGFSYDEELEVSEGQLSWDEHALTVFLGAAVPVEMKADFNAAGPLLFKAMVRLGSFPFHNRQTPSRLGADEAFLAIIFLLRLHDNAREFSFWDEDMDDDIVQGFRDRWFRGLMFQVMRNKPELDSQHELQDQGKSSTRDPEDDEHLIRARKLLQNNNYTCAKGNPKVRVSRPPVIAVSELPSSRSRDLTGTIPREGLKALLSVLCGIGNYTSVNIEQLIETAGTDWHGFDTILTQIEPHFSAGFRHLFDPFLHFNEWVPIDAELPGRQDIYNPPRYDGLFRYKPHYGPGHTQTQCPYGPVSISRSVNSA